MGVLSGPDPTFVALPGTSPVTSTVTVDFAGARPRPSLREPGERVDPGPIRPGEPGSALPSLRDGRRLRDIQSTKRRCRARPWPSLRTRDGAIQFMNYLLEKLPFGPRQSRDNGSEF
jgi:hypothetical protein